MAPARPRIPKDHKYCVRWVLWLAVTFVNGIYISDDSCQEMLRHIAR